MTERRLTVRDRIRAGRVARHLVITRVQVLQYGDDPEVEPGQAAVRAFFDWPGRAEGGKADPKTIHRFVTANEAALRRLDDGLPGAIRWALSRLREHPAYARLLQ